MTYTIFILKTIQEKDQGIIKIIQIQDVKDQDVVKDQGILSKI